MGFSDKAPSNTELVLRTGQIIFYYYDFGIQTTDDKQIVTIHKKQNDGNDPSKLI
jgi:hypothetical protein